MWPVESKYIASITFPVSDENIPSCSAETADTEAAVPSHAETEGRSLSTMDQQPELGLQGRYGTIVSFSVAFLEIEEAGKEILLITTRAFMNG